MKTFAAWGVAVALVLVAAVSAEEKKADKFDVTKLVGDWVGVSGEKEGEKIAAESLKGKVNFTKDTITIKATMDGNEIVFVMAYKLDPSKTPCMIDMVGKEGPVKDQEAKGIIEVKGDELKLCYAHSGGDRPTKFGTKEKSKQLLIVLKRAK